ncbi:hypothetical protein BVY02_02270, partial [bacterium J17]
MTAKLVTGAAGFIGSHVSEKLLERGDKVVGIDNLNDYYPVAFKKENIALLEKYENFSFVHADITDLEAVESLFKKHNITQIGHLAARAGVRPSIENPYIYQEANFQGTLNLLEISRQHEVANFVLSSSSSVYGNSKQIPFRE